MVEAAAAAGAAFARRHTQIRWVDDLAELQEVLASLPPAAACSRAQYVELMQPTGVPKRHAVASEDGVTTALISVRRRRNYWEPVACQCLPAFIAPAIDNAALGRALNATGLEIRVSFGLGPEAEEMGARLCYAYEIRGLTLDDAYEDHWKLHQNWHMRAVKKARKTCESMQVRIDGEGDLEWILGQWTEAWRDDPEQEVTATPDRLRFWTALRAHPTPNGLRVHTVTLLADGRPVAGCVHTSLGDTVTFQCSAREEAFEKQGVGTRVMDASLSWAKQAGFAHFILGSGEYKARWAPVFGTRYGAVFRPAVMDALYRFDPW